MRQIVICEYGLYKYNLINWLNVHYIFWTINFFILTHTDTHTDRQTRVYSVWVKTTDFVNLGNVWSCRRWQSAPFGLMQRTPRMRQRSSTLQTESIKTVKKNLHTSNMFEKTQINIVSELSGAVHGSLVSAPALLVLRPDCVPSPGHWAVVVSASVARDCLCLFIANQVHQKWLS